MQESCGCGCDGNQHEATGRDDTDEGQENKKSRVFEINALETIEPESVNAVYDGGWQELVLTVDSGASETVMSADTLPGVPIREGLASKRGVEYEVANGTRIPNEGEKEFKACMQDGGTRTIKAQICDVNKPLLSVKRIVDAGNRVVFDPNGSYIQDCSTGESMELGIQGGMYTLKVWVKTDSGESF